MPKQKIQAQVRKKAVSSRTLRSGKDRKLEALRNYRNDGLDIRNVHLFVHGDQPNSEGKTLTSLLRSIDAANRKHRSQAEEFANRYSARPVGLFLEESQPILRFAYRQKIPSGWARVSPNTLLYRPAKTRAGDAVRRVYRRTVTTPAIFEDAIEKAVERFLIPADIDLNTSFLQYQGVEWVQVRIAEDRSAAVVSFPVLDFAPHLLEAYIRAVADGMEPWDDKNITNAVRVRDLVYGDGLNVSSQTTQSWYVAEYMREAAENAVRLSKERERSARRRKASK